MSGLDALVFNESRAVRQTAAVRPDLTQVHIERLAKDDCVVVRRLIAERADLPPAEAFSLAKDRDTDVRLSLAANPVIPAICRLALVGDFNSFVRDEAMFPLFDVSAHELIAFAAAVSSSPFLRSISDITLLRADAILAMVGIPLSFARPL